MLTQALLMLAAGTPAAPATPLASSAFVVRAARLHVGDGRTMTNAVLVVRDGRIESVGTDVEAPAGLPVFEHGGDVTPGLIALRDFSTGGAELNDSTRPIMDTAELAYAFDAKHSDLSHFAAAGVTAAVLAPPYGFVGGLTAVFKPDGLLKPHAHLYCSLSSADIKPNIDPTSFAGAIAHLEQRLADKSGSFGEVAAGTLPLLIRVDARHEVQRAAAFAQKHSLSGALVGAPRAGELADTIKAAGLSAVLPCFKPGMDERALRSAAALAEAGVPFGFCLDAPTNSPAALRLSAAASVRYGLDPQAGLRALTLDAATIAGVADRIGSLEAGKDADFVLWSGDPLEVSSSIVATYINGVRAFGGEQ